MYSCSQLRSEFLSTAVPELALSAPNHIHYYLLSLQIKGKTNKNNFKTLIFCITLGLGIPQRCASLKDTICYSFVLDYLPGRKNL